MTYSEAVSRCWLEVDLDAIRQNYKTACNMVQSDIRVIPVLKANAYGMGIVQIAKTLYAEGARQFAVAAPAEAEQILSAVKDAKVLTMGLCGRENAESLIERGQLLTLYSKENGKMLSEAAKAAGCPAHVHIKIDTGLHRLGFDLDTAVTDILAILENSNIIPEGVFTHLAIHSPESDMIQIKKLERVCAELRAHGINIAYVHALDSIGMVRYVKMTSGMNAVRIGAWIYGVEPKGSEFAHCVCPAKFKARISEIRHVKKGELLGYDDDHPLMRDSVIATVSAGYIDGTPRVGKGWTVEVHGMLAPVIGIACMDQLMCDVTDIDNAREGDIITFCGGIIDIETYAKMGSLNHNEAWARIGPRVPRIYYKNGTVCHIESELLI